MSETKILSLTHFDRKPITDELGAITWVTSGKIYFSNNIKKFGNYSIVFDIDNSCSLGGTFSSDSNIYLLKDKVFHDFEFFWYPQRDLVNCNILRFSYPYRLGDTIIAASIGISVNVYKETKKLKLNIAGSSSGIGMSKNDEKSNFVFDEWHHVLVRLFNGRIYVFIDNECLCIAGYTGAIGDDGVDTVVQTITVGEKEFGYIDEFVVKKTVIAEDDTKDYGENATITIPTEAYTEEKNTEEDKTKAKNITSVKWEASNLPNGLSINESTGVISGTPDVDPGNYTATVKVTTNYGSDSKTITIKVAAPDNWKPVIEAGQTINITAGEAMTAYTVKGTNVTLSNS